jgi:hypothetical protein
VRLLGVDPPQGQDQDDNEGAEEDEHFPAYGETQGRCNILPGAPQGVPQGRHRDDGTDNRQPVKHALQRMWFCHRYPFISLVFIDFANELKFRGHGALRSSNFIIGQNEDAGNWIITLETMGLF